MLASPNTTKRVLQADFDGDGKQDEVVGTVSPSTGRYSRIVVRTTQGKTLLESHSQVGYTDIFSVQAGAPFPILVLVEPTGNMFQASAFLFKPSQGQLEPLAWNGDPRGYGFFIRSDFKRGAIALGQRSGPPELYRFEHGELTQQRSQ